VLAAIENLPEELDDQVDQVYINFPWGSLLKGVVLVDAIAWKNIKKITKPGAFIDLVFGYNIACDRKEVERLGLPQVLDEAYVKNIMLPKIFEYGFACLKLEALSVCDLKNYPTSWAKTLSFGYKRLYFCLQLQKV
jgi:16S rRNA (adenine(1408)-N(1))-methyltransferase